MKELYDRDKIGQLSRKTVELPYNHNIARAQLSQ
jgi:hypothetical protein